MAGKKRCGGYMWSIMFISQCTVMFMARYPLNLDSLVDLSLGSVQHHQQNHGKTRLRFSTTNINWLVVYQYPYHSKLVIYCHDIPIIIVSCLYIPIWLVVYLPTPLKNDGVKVSWDDFSFPTEWKV